MNRFLLLLILTSFVHFTSHAQSDVEVLNKMFQVYKLNVNGKAAAIIKDGKLFGKKGWTDFVLANVSSITSVEFEQEPGNWGNAKFKISAKWKLAELNGTGEKFSYNNETLGLNGESFEMYEFKFGVLMEDDEVQHLKDMCEILKKIAGLMYSKSAVKNLIKTAETIEAEE